MADFFGRLAERALGVAVVAQPAIAPRFALGPRLAVESSVIEAPAVGSHPEPGPDVDARRVEADAQTAPATLAARIPAPLPVRAETKPTVRIGDLPQPAPTPETTLQVTERRSQPDIARPVPQPELRLEASAARPEPLAPMAEPAARNDLYATSLDASRVEPVETAETKPAAPHPTMPAVVWRDGQPPSNSRQSSRAEEPVETVETKPAAPHPTMPPVVWRDGQPPSNSRQSSRAEESETPEPVVRVSIGRIEVRAVFPEQPQRQPAPLPRSSALSLSEYLKQRDRGMR
jgi:hypothetical protein